MVDFFKRKHVQILKYLLPEGISVQDKFCNLIYVSTLIGSIGTLIVSMFLTPTLMTLLTILAAIIVISISIYLAVFKRKHKVAALLVVLFINEIIFPIMYFYNGGIHSGMQMWFIIGLAFYFLALDGKTGIITFIIGAITLSTCFLLEASGYITPKALEGYTWSFDVIQSLILVSAIFGVFVKFQTTLYRHQDKELIESKEKAEAANKAKTVFLANMSHEIRTPINAIMGLNELINRDTKEDETRQYTEQIMEASENLLCIVNNILDITKIESGKMEIISEEYDLASLIESCCGLVDICAKKKGIEFKVVKDSAIPNKLIGDKYHISRILTNLLTNAVKYTEKGYVELSVSYEQLKSDEINLIVSVKDSGIGISEKDIEELFDEFKRVDLKRNRSIEGTGLGLSIIEGLIKQMGGKIDVSSELGKGSVFTVTILQMVSANQIDENNEENAKDQEHKVEKESKIIAPTVKILVVDDVLINRVIVTKLLTPMQLQFDTAENGEQALELCYKTKYDLILMDHMMPVMDGIEVFNTLREKNNINQETPVVVMTANAQKGIDEEYKKIGFNDYISKPMTGVELEEKVLKFLPKSKIEAV